MRIALALLLLGTAAHAKEVTLRTSDGLVLKAEWTPPPAARRGVLVALHEEGLNRMVYLPLVGPAAAEGLGVLAVDLRGHGASVRQGKKDLGPRVEARDETLFAGLGKDVAAAMAFLKRQGFGPEKVVIVGASAGASAALDYAATSPKLKGAVLLTPGKHILGIASMQHITKWGDRPLLIVAAKSEAGTGARPIYDALESKRHAVLLELPQPEAHGTRMFGRVPDIERRIAEWSAIQLGRPLK